MNIKKVVYAELKKVTDSEITPESILDKDLGIDEMKKIYLAVGLDMELGIEISDEALEDLHTVKDIIDYFRSKLEN